VNVELAPRNMPRPTTSMEGPHRQLDGQSSAEVWRGLVAQASALPHVETGRSQVSPASSIALFFNDLDTANVESTNLSPGNRLEPVHIHGVEDTSTHLCLPLERAREVCDLGWGEPHPYGDFGTEIMIYGPQDEEELAVALGLIEESLSFAREIAE
jgi:hypothetical protein